MKRTLIAGLIMATTLVLTFAFVRISLDWSDSLPYDGQTTERRYLVLILIAFAIFGAGCSAAVIVFRKLGKRTK